MDKLASAGRAGVRSAALRAAALAACLVAAPVIFCHVFWETELTLGSDVYAFVAVFSIAAAAFGGALLSNWLTRRRLL